MTSFKIIEMCSIEGVNAFISKNSQYTLFSQKLNFNDKFKNNAY